MFFVGCKIPATPTISGYLFNGSNSDMFNPVFFNSDGERDNNN